MADAPKRLYGPTGLPATITTLYTVPAATTAILRYLRLFNVHASTDYTWQLYLGVAGSGNALWSGQTLPANSLFEWAGWIPMTAGEVLQGQASSTNVGLLAAGVEVT